MIKEKPILFNGEMVRAILEGRKTQTRRCNGLEFVNDPKNGGPDEWGIAWADEGHSGPGWYAEWLEYPEEGSTFIKCPFEVGQRRYIRETLRQSFEGGLFYNADNKLLDAWPDDYIYAGGLRSIIPNIHTPKWSSRITIEITDIRVERVQDIPEEDARAEGIQSEKLVIDLTDDCMPHNCIGYVSGLHPFPKGMIHVNAKEAFQELWGSINGKPRSDGLGISWEANPWVWALTFKVG